MAARARGAAGLQRGPVPGGGLAAPHPSPAAPTPSGLPPSLPSPAAARSAPRPWRRPRPGARPHGGGGRGHEPRGGAGGGAGRAGRRSAQRGRGGAGRPARTSAVADGGRRGRRRSRTAALRWTPRHAVSYRANGEGARFGARELALHGGGWHREPRCSVFCAKNDL